MTDFVRLSDIAYKTAEDPRERFALDVLMGLTSRPKLIPPKYFYDKKGSELFQKISETEDYYLTRSEMEILRRYSSDIVKLVGEKELNIVELGAGDGRKTKVLLETFLKSDIKIRYCPIDISESAIAGLIGTLKKEFPKLPTMGIVSEYFEALRWLRDSKQGRNFVLFLGSNIGNFNAPQAQVFLKTMWNALNHGDYVLMGCDLKKNIDILLHAYNDRDGYTHQFNLNLLERMNRELGANFDLSKFEHFGTYNVQLGAMESFLLSTAQQFVEVKALNKRFRFKPYEPIHVEFSFKYLPQEVQDLATETGYKPLQTFTDTKGYFLDAVIQVEKLV